MLKFVLLLLLTLPCQLLAVDTTSVVESIRERYYTITNDLSSLKSIEIDSAQFFLKNGKICIAKLHEQEGTYEFYYDIENKKNFHSISHNYSYQPYFVYFNAKNPDEDVRAYYTDKDYLVRYQMGDERLEIQQDEYPPPPLDKKIACKNNSVINTYFNVFYQSAKNYSNRIANIEKKVSAIRNSNLTEKDSSYFSGGGETIETNYFNEDGELVKIKVKGGTTKSEEVSFSYYNNGVKIYEHSATLHNFFLQRDVYINKTYFSKNGKKIKTIDYADAGCRIIPRRMPDRDEKEIENYSTELLEPKILIYN